MGLTAPAFRASRKIRNCDSGMAAADGKTPVAGVTLNFPAVKNLPPAMRHHVEKLFDHLLLFCYCYVCKQGIPVG